MAFKSVTGREIVFKRKIENIVSIALKVKVKFFERLDPFHKIRSGNGSHTFL